MSLRDKAILRAAEGYAASCCRFMTYVRSAPDNLVSADWSDEFRQGYDEKFRELEQAKERLLRLAQRL